MNTRDFIPRADNKFLVWLKTMVAYLLTKATEWGVPRDDVNEIETLTADFETALETTENPLTRTKVAIQVKNDARKVVESKTRVLLKAYVTYNPAVSDADREAMGLPIHKNKRTPAPVASTYPDFDVDSSVIRRLTIHFYDQGSKKSKAKPAGQHGAEIRWVISDTPIIDVEDLSHSAFDTHTPFTLEFQGHERGKTVYLCLCWENTRGEKGPWSEIVSAIIP
ncbi:MAG: hypothetical protein LBF04_03165 [Prevotellaceae bacterium]|jgi:hypothetical protein|nr:hypothetical protein [Prevotellaceae bacterium]